MGTLKQKLDYINATKTAIKDAIIAKGQPISDSDTFRSYVDKINAISGGGGGKVDVGAIGLKCGYSSFSEIPNEFDFHNVTDMSYMFSNCYGFTTVDLPHTENVTNMSGMFQNCNSLTAVNLPHTENVTNMSYMFQNCNSLTAVNLPHTENVTNMSYMFSSCSTLTSIDLPHTENVTYTNNMFAWNYMLQTVKIGDVSKVTDMGQMFSTCEKLNDVTMLGNPANATNIDYMFEGVATTGIFTYDYRYDYSKIIKKLPPGWTAKRNFTPTACSELTITADDIEGNEKYTIVHYTAVTTGEPTEFGTVTIHDSAVYEVGFNPSSTDSRQVTVTFEYLGQTATTTITQSAYVEPAAVLGEYFYYTAADEQKLKDDIITGKITGITWEEIVAKNDEIKAAYPGGWVHRKLTNEDIATNYDSLAVDPLKTYNNVNDIKICPKWDFSNIARTINHIFYNGYYGGGTNKQYVYIPDINASKATSMWNMFQGQEQLQSLGVVDCSSIDYANDGNLDKAFIGCSVLKHVGGIKNIRVATNMSYSSLLTRESILNIFNSMGTYRTEDGGKRQTWIFHADAYARLTPEDIKIATDKGYNVASAS